MAANAADTAQAAAAASATTAATAQAAAQTNGKESTTATGDTQVAEWFLSDGVKGTGAKPDWLVGDKYKTVADQAQAYPKAREKINELEQKLRGYGDTNAAPLEYTLPDLAELGGDIEWKKEDPLLGKAFEVAKKHKISQATFNDLAKEVMIPIIRNYELIDIAAEKALMGERADERLNGVMDWAKRNLGDEQFAIVNAALGKWSRPHEVFKAFETILSATRQAPAPKPGDDVRGGPGSVDDINRKYRTPDPTTKRALIDTPEGLKKYREELAAVVGTGNHIEIVGKR